jgi:hypothetical protein
MHKTRATLRSSANVALSTGLWLRAKAVGGALQKNVRRSISRVLSKGVSPLCDHSSGTTIARRLSRPTRTRQPTNEPLPEQAQAAWCPYSVLLLVGLAMPSSLRSRRWALTPPFHPYLSALRRSILCGAIPKALPESAAPAGLTRHHVCVEPGLSSLAPFRGLQARSPDRLTSLSWPFALKRARVRQHGQSVIQSQHR